MDANDCDGDNVDLQYGTVLTIGFLPGLKVDAIPLLRRKEVTDSEAVSGLVLHYLL